MKAEIMVNVIVAVKISIFIHNFTTRHNLTKYPKITHIKNKNSVFHSLNNYALHSKTPIIDLFRQGDHRSNQMHRA